MQSSQETNWQGYQLSGWWKRVGAYLIDGLVTGLAVFIVAILLYLLVAIPFIGSESGNISDGAAIGIFLFVLILTPLFSILIYILYYGISMSRPGTKNGQSWGKQIFKITVKKEDLTDITFGYAILRQFVVIYLLFSFIGSMITFGILPILNYLWPLWDDKRQALHDKMVGSRVVIEEDQQIEAAKDSD